MKLPKWTFMNTWDEWHAFVVGWCETICPWPPQHSYYGDANLFKEYHYYLFGRAIGLLTLYAAIVVTIKLFGG